jgi:hypothetical protein
MKRILPARALAGALSACAPTAQTPAQAVFALEASYDAALEVAVAYATLPACGAEAPPLCSDRALVRRVNTAAHQAWVAIRAAQALAVAVHPDATALAAARANAERAFADLTELTASLKVN